MAFSNKFRYQTLQIKDETSVTSFLAAATTKSARLDPQRLLWRSHKEFKMTPVFLGGSRTVSKLNGMIREQLTNLMNHRCTILIGDANGADKAMQRFFADHQYENVIVFCMNEFRNNLGSWQTRVIRADRKTRGFSYFTIKDKEMSREAKCGLMLWDGLSKGTLRNIFELVRDHKKVLVYLAPEKRFYKLTTEEELADLLSRCDSAVIQNLTRALGPELQLDLKHPEMSSPLTGR